MMPRPRLWLVVIDPAGIAHVVRKTASAVLGSYSLRTEEHARVIADRHNEGKTLRPEDVEVTP